MNRAGFSRKKRSQPTRCSRCGQTTPDYDIVNCGSAERGYQEICGKCFNAEVAESVGLSDFSYLQFAPVELVDCTGKAHRFHFRTRLFGTGVALDAFELHDGNPTGYQFQVIDDPGCDLLALLGRLIEKMRRALSVKHVTEERLGLQISEQQVVRGRIQWDDDEDGRVPLLIVDGREIRWQEFGRMLMTFEGWQFKLEIRDKSEEL